MIANKILALLLCFASLQLWSQEQSFVEFNDLSYLSPEQVEVDSLQRLNLVMPKNADKPPILLWIGGGAWSFVNRHMEMDLARKFAADGIAVAAVGHRLSKGAFNDTGRTSGYQHPAHIEDVAAAFKWLLEQAGEYGYDRNQIFVGGFSSGAHPAALLAMDARYLEKYQLSPELIRGIIPIGGTYDINHYYSVFKEHENPDRRPLAETHVMDVFGNDIEAFADASPVTYLDKLDTPMLLISESGLYNYTRLFEEQLRQSAYRNIQVVHIFDFDHAGLWRDISLAEYSQTRSLMIDFIKSKLGA